MTQTMERGSAPAQHSASSAPTRDYGAPPRQDYDMSLFLSRWLKVWVALITVILIVVIVYLWFITGSLASINKELGPTERNVAGAGSDVQRLPDQVQAINGSLANIDPSLRPISGKLDQIIGALSPIDARLKTTSSSLVDTSGMLVRALGQAQDIRGVVAAAQSPGSAGTELIWNQVAAANSVLSGGVRADAQNIVTGLNRTNDHLDRIP